MDKLEDFIRAVMEAVVWIGAIAACIVLIWAELAFVVWFGSLLLGLLI